MRKLDQVQFLIGLLAAAAQYEKLPREQQNAHRAALIALNVGLVPKSIGVANPIVAAIEFFGRGPLYREQNISFEILALSARLKEEHAWRFYERNYADQAA